jgi:hypothetical protein
MAASGYMSDGFVKKFSDAVLVIADSGGSNTLTVTLEEGYLSYTEKDSFTWHKDRGAADHRRAGEAEPMDVSFAVKYTGYYSSTSDSPAPYEALTGRGQASAWTSTTSTTSDVWSVDLELKYTDPADDSAWEQMAFEDFACATIAFTEGEEASVITFTGDAIGSSSSNMFPTITGAAS